MSEGKRLVEDMQAAGFSDEEIGSWAAQERNTMGAAGFSEAEIDTWFGRPPLDTGPIKALVNENIKAAIKPETPDGQPKPVKDFYEALDLGFQHSVSGLMKAKPENKVLDENAPMASRIASSVGTLAGDLPYMVGGALVGMGGGPIGAAGGAFGLPMGMRSILMDAYERGSSTTFGDFWDIASGAIIETAKGWVTGAATAGVGGAVAAAPIASPTIRAGATLLSEVGTMVTVGSALEGHVPKAQDFVDAAILVGGLKGATGVAAKLRSIYAKTGTSPDVVLKDIERDPTIQGELLSENIDVPQTYRAPPTPVAPTPAPDMVRMYHGGTADTLTGGGSRWFTSDLKYAEGYARKSGDAGNVYYVDVPFSNKIFEVDYPEQSVRRGFTVNSDLPESFAGKMQLLKNADEIKNSPETFKVRGPEGQVTEFAQIGPKGEPATPGSIEAAKQKVMEKVVVGGTEGKAPLTLSGLYEATVDALHPIKKLQEEAGLGQAGPYEQMRLVAGAPGKADAMLKYGPFRPEDPGRTIGPSFNKIVEPVTGDLEGFRAYLTSARALEIEAQGKKSGIDTDAARQVVDNAPPAVKKAARELVTFQNSVLDYAQRQGLLTPEAAGAMKEANKNYVPFFRVMDDATASGKSLKELKGSVRDIVDPLESVMKNTFAMVAAADKNAAKLAVVEFARAEGIAKAERVAADRGFAEFDVADALRDSGMKDVPPDLLRAIKAVLAPTKGTTITALRNGKVESWRVSPELADAVNYTNRDSANLIFKVLGGPARLARAGAVFSPDFIAKSPIRDFFSMAINSKDAVVHPFEAVRSIMSIAKQDKVYQDWMRAGGANSSVVALDRRYIQENLLKLDQETGLMSRVWNIATTPAQKTMLGLRAASEFTDTMMRLPEFKKRMAEGASPGEAAFASREVTVDFARIGAQMSSINALVPFLNAGIQGLDRTFREAKERPVAFMAKGTAYITIPTIGLFVANSSDPNYWEIPQWERDLFWIVPVGGTYWRIPKPFELGLMFGTLPERVLTDFMTEQPEAWREFHKSVLQVFNPVGWPSFVAPAMEQMTNKSFSGAPIVPKNTEKLLPEYQYNNYTTETSKALGRLLGTFPGLESAAINDETVFGGMAKALTTPVLIENYVRGWTGGLGMYALQVADYGLRKAGVVPDPVLPASTLADIPFVKSFVVRYPSASADSVVRFYEQYHDTKTRYDSWMSRAREGDTESMARIQAAGGDRIFVTLDAFKDTLTEQQKLVNMIFKNPDFSKEEKRQLIDTLYYQMISVARTGNEAFREMNRSLKR